MHRYGITLVSVFGTITLTTLAEIPATDTSKNPYEGIVERNIFNLKDPPQPAPAIAPVTVTLPKITLTGITTILNTKRALLRWPAAPKPGEAPRELNSILSEGEAQDEVEVVEINEKADSVRVRNHGELQTLNFANNGVKLVANAMPATGPSPMPSMPANNLPAPIATIPSPVAARAIPSRLPNSVGAQPGNAGGRVSPAYAGPGGASAGYAGPGGVATLYAGPGGLSFGMPGSGTSAAASPASEPSPLSPEAQAIILEMNRDATKNLVQQGKLPPLPPGPFATPGPSGGGPPPLPPVPGRR